MKTIQEKSIELYAKLAEDSKNITELAGRYQKDEGVELEILNDILFKLDFKKNERVLDIGCGCGILTHLFAEKLFEIGCKITFFDIPEVIKKLKNEIEINREGQKFISGIFPGSDNLSFSEKKYDKICIYSVLHYTDNPESFIDEAVKLLNFPGKLLIGDIPNINKKGRFLSTEFGREFDAKYQGKNVNEIENFKSHIDYALKVKNQNLKINDDLIYTIFNKYRLLGYNVYILPQNSTLPFFHTREDVIIEHQ